MLWNCVNFLSHEECQTILQEGNASSLQAAELATGFRPELRLTQVCALQQPLPHLNQRVLQELSRVQVPGYELSSFGPWQFGRYDQGSFFAWHRDNDGVELVRRYYSVVIALGGDYTGGELETEWQGELRTWTLSPGELVLFPSSARHQVKEVTSGTRYSLVNWIGLVKVGTAALL